MSTTNDALPETGEAKTTAIVAVTSDTMILIGPGYKLQIPPEAEARKARLLASAAKITAIVTAEDAAEAQEEIKAMTKFRTDLEKGRKIVKAPVSKWIDDEIDGKAKTFGEPVKSEEDRLVKIVSAHALKVEEERLAEVRRLAELERQRLAAERAAEAARIEEQRQIEIAAQKAEAARIEAARVAALAAAPAAAAINPTDDEEEDIEAQLAAAEAIDAANAADKAAAQARADAEAAELKRANDEADLAMQMRRSSGGSSIRTSGVTFPLDFEVQDLTALYAFDPTLVKLEPKAREILARIKADEAKLNGQIPTIPGLRIFRDAKVGRR